MIPDSIIIEANAPNQAEIILPNVSRVFSVKENVQSVTVLDKYSVVGLGTSADKSFVFTQASPASTWTINHGLNKFPSVSVVDSSGKVVIGETTYLNENTVQVSFNGVFSGKAYLN